MKNYKKYQLLFSLNLFVISIFTFFITMCSLNSYNEYTKLNSVYILDNIIDVMLTTKDLKQLEKNNYLYLNSKRKRVEILNITKNILKKGNTYYHQTRLKIDGISSKTNLNISIYQKKRRIIRLFFDCWKEE